MRDSQVLPFPQGSLDRGWCFQKQISGYCTPAVPKGRVYRLLFDMKRTQTLELSAIVCSSCVFAIIWTLKHGRHIFVSTKVDKPTQTPMYPTPAKLLDETIPSKATHVAFLKKKRAAHKLKQLVHDNLDTFNFAYGVSKEYLPYGTMILRCNTAHLR